MTYASVTQHLSVTLSEDSANLVAAIREGLLNAGADAVGFVELDRTAIAPIPDLLLM